MENFSIYVDHLDHGHNPLLKIDLEKFFHYFFGYLPCY